MRRHVIPILVIPFLAWDLSFAADNTLPGINLKDRNTLTAFYELWKESLYGREPDRIERAAWIRSKQEGKFEFIKWKLPTEKQTISWLGDLPENVIAAVHTHPSSVNPKPSKQDAAVAIRLKIPVYTISRKGIWKVTPDGTIAKEAGWLWYKEVKESSYEKFQRIQPQDTVTAQ